MTSAGLHIDGAVSSSSAAPLLEFQRRTGLTWKQLAKLFGVSRRTGHFWASGKPATSNNEERLRRVLAVVRKLDSGVPLQTRAALLTSVNDDGSVFYALVAGNDDDAVIAADAVRVGARSPRTMPIRPTTPLAATEARRRSPPPPAPSRDRLLCASTRLPASCSRSALAEET